MAATTSSAVITLTVKQSARKFVKDASSLSTWVDSSTGRPTIQQLNLGCRTIFEDIVGFFESVRADKWALFWACIIADIIGVMSYVILLLGEVVDLWWAPLFGFFLQYMFGSVFMTSLGAVEELLPFTDFVPTATLCWCLAHIDCLEKLRKLLKIQRHVP